MWPNATAGGSERHHHVVQPRIRQETEFAQQRVSSRQMQIQALHQKRPVASGQFCDARFGKRPVFEHKFFALTQHETRFHILRARELPHVVNAQQFCKRGHRLLNVFPMFLPVFGHELTWRESAEKRFGSGICVCVHVASGVALAR